MAWFKLEQGSVNWLKQLKKYPERNFRKKFEGEYDCKRHQKFTRVVHSKMG